MKKTLGLALGAGGSRGIAHIGFLQALDEEGVRPDFVAGSSMGSIVGACYCKGMPPAEMLEIVRELRPSDIVNLGISPITKLGLMKWTKVRRMMSAFLEDCDFSELAIPFCCVSVDLLAGKLVELSSGSVVDAALASSSIPTVFRPVEKDGMLLIDGGVLCRVPARQVKKMGADVVVAVDVLGKVRPVDKVPNVVSLTMRTYEVMDSHKTAAQKRSLRRYYDLWLEPDMGDVNQFRVKFEQSVYDAGYLCGKQNAEKIKKLLQP